MTWIKSVPPKMLHDQFGIYNGLWMKEMDRCWIREEDGVCVCSRMLRTEKFGNVEHVTISNTKKFLSTDGSGELGWAEKQKIKNELFGENRIAIEVFPKSDKVVDVCDIYHLWVFDKKFELPFGIHPKQYKSAINRGYSMTKEELEILNNYYKVSGNSPESSLFGDSI